MKRKLRILLSVICVMLLILIAFRVANRMYNLKNDPMKQVGSMWQSEDGDIVFTVDENKCGSGVFQLNGIKTDIIIYTAASEEAWIDYYFTDEDGSCIVMFTELGSFNIINSDEFVITIGEVSMYSYENGDFLKHFSIDNEKLKFYRVSE